TARLSHRRPGAARRRRRRAERRASHARHRHPLCSMWARGLLRRGRCRESRVRYRAAPVRGARGAHSVPTSESPGFSRRLRAAVEPGIRGAARRGLRYVRAGLRHAGALVSERHRFRRAVSGRKCPVLSLARMGGFLPGVPAHLRQFVVEQDYGQYTDTDQAVWRFVLERLSSTLNERAHPAYKHGLGATGIRIDRIPSIAEMNDKLGRFGWGAVAVDGFIPPRAFQEFQAAGILPIAAEIRTREHLEYTPAPDIIHEAAGHAPILPEETFAA